MLTVRRVVTSWSTVRVPFAASSVALARRRMAAELRSHGVAHGTVEDAILVLSEILSNALKHARPLPSGDVQIRWSLGDGAVALEVTDGGSPTRPHVSIASTSATGGRGLGIVGDLSNDWGVTEHGDATTVWAVVAWPPHGRPRLR